MRELSWSKTLTLVAGAWLFTCTALAPRSALATERPIGVGPVEYVGEFPPYFEREIERTVLEALQNMRGMAVTLTSASCAQVECLRESAAQADVEVVIMTRAVMVNRDYRVEMVAYTIEDEQVLARVELECAVCGQRELLDAIPARAVELQAKIAEAVATRTTPPRLTVDGTPGRAKLTLDGDGFGEAPAALEVSTGEHALEIKAPGHAAQIHRWVAVAGVEERVDYELTPLASPTPPPNQRGARIGGWVALSLGVAGTGTGIALLVIDGRNHGPTCGPGLVDANGACPNVYGTAVAGAVGLGIGLAAVATGAGLLIHHRRQRNSDARARVTISGLGVQF